MKRFTCAHGLGISEVCNECDEEAYENARAEELTMCYACDKNAGALCRECFTSEMESTRAERDAALARAEKAERERDALARNVVRLTEERNMYAPRHEQDAKRIAQAVLDERDAAIRERDEARAELAVAEQVAEDRRNRAKNAEAKLQAFEADAVALREALVQIQDHARDVHSPITALGRVDIVTIRTLAATEAGAPLLAELVGLRAQVAVLETVREAADRYLRFEHDEARIELCEALRRAADSKGGG